VRLTISRLAQSLRLAPDQPPSRRPRDSRKA